MFRNELRMSHLMPRVCSSFAIILSSIIIWQYNSLYGLSHRCSSFISDRVYLYIHYTNADTLYCDRVHEWEHIRNSHFISIIRWWIIEACDIIYCRTETMIVMTIIINIGTGARDCWQIQISKVLCNEVKDLVLCNLSQRCRMLARIR